MAKVVVFIPYRPDRSGWRAKAFQQVHARYLELAGQHGWVVCVGDSGDHPFSIARTWNLLSDRVDVEGRWDVAVRVLADCFIEDPEDVVQAVELVEHLEVPHLRPFVRSFAMNRNQTQAFYRTGKIPKRDRQPLMYEGTVVHTRDLWEQVGGFDPRFIGYGAEDYAFQHGVRVLYGEPERSQGVQIGLWHPAARGNRSSRSVDPYFKARTANMQLLQQEITAITDPDGWRQYLDKRRGLVGR